MPFIGNQPADKFLTLEKQTFTTSATDTYSLDREVSSVNDIELFLNNVRQEPTEAYTISGTTLTLASAITSSDELYCVYQGRAIGTQAPATNTVTTAMLVDANVTTAKIADANVTLAKLSATGTKDATTFLRGDNTFAEAGGGKIAQVVYQNFTSAFSTSSATYADTGLTLAITPTASNSKIYITANMNGVTHNGTSFASCKMFEDSTELEEWSGISGYADNATNSVTLCFQRDASSTSARTYKIQMANKPNTNGTIRINNRAASPTNESCQSNMMIMEVLA